MPEQSLPARPGRPTEGRSNRIRAWPWTLTAALRPAPSTAWPAAQSPLHANAPSHPTSALVPSLLAVAPAEVCSVHHLPHYARKKVLEHRGLSTIHSPTPPGGPSRALPRSPWPCRRASLLRPLPPLPPGEADAKRRVRGIPRVPPAPILAPPPSPTLPPMPTTRTRPPHHRRSCESRACPCEGRGTSTLSTAACDSFRGRLPRHSFRACRPAVPTRDDKTTPSCPATAMAVRSNDSKLRPSSCGSNPKAWTEPPQAQQARKKTREDDSIRLKSLRRPAARWVAGPPRC